MFHLRSEVYWDNNATTKPSKAVVREMVRVLENTHGNPSSPHRAAHDARALLERSRQVVAQAIGAMRTRSILWICHRGDQSDPPIRGGIVR
ncbi:MAG: aminotransferase class V-fold PLP-dependent enzyme [Fibrobacteres bacterium]|nr:aminotransferase class V-fold PLP-dependent enzyme [Fibrobacterota bacterium]